MNKYPINITATVNEENLQKGVFIFIYRASRIPPHIGVVVNGLLYDITSIGPNIDLPVADFYKTAVKRKTEVLFVELKDSKVSNLNEIITAMVKNHYKVTTDTSCLVPVKEFISKTYVNVSETNFIFELLPLLYENDLITDVWELNLAHKIKNNIFEIIKYTKQDVEDCLAALNRKEKITC
ncbi:MAG: hypothetical protein COB15_14245 [Flavobacteriales bacterium]|nr:MAG: hypothetical protein COB15_14245 [Flavobacteriales bacterium]